MGSKDLGIKKSEFVKKTQFLYDKKRHYENSLIVFVFMGYVINIKAKESDAFCLQKYRYKSQMFGENIN